MKTVLENNRNPQYPSEVHHKYNDKFTMVEFLSNTALASQLNCLELLGLTPEGLKQLQDWSADRTLTLSLRSEYVTSFCNSIYRFRHRCTFLREVTREVESATSHVTQFLNVFTSSSKTITKVTEYFWQVEVEYEIFAFQGNLNIIFYTTFETLFALVTSWWLNLSLKMWII